MSYVATTTPARALRRVRTPLIVLAVIVLASLVIALLQGSSSGDDLDPTSFTQGGARAVATLLADRGSPVARVNTIPPQGGAGSVVVPDSGLLDGAALKSLLTTAAATPVIVIVSDDGFSPDALGLSVAEDSGEDTDDHDPDCSLPAAVTAGQAQTGDRSFDIGTLPTGFTLRNSCYGDTLLDLVPDGGGDGGGELIVLGSSAFLTNKQLADEGNAALALSLIDRQGPVVWVQPRPGTSSGDGSQSVVSLLPHRLKVAAWELAVLALLLALWRARRLGPVVRERLPVSVRTAETVRGRARLYRGTGARDRAALALREAARARLASRLGLGPQTRPEALVDAVATRSGRDTADVGALLYGAGPDMIPADDPALVALADDLDTLIREAQQ